MSFFSEKDLATVPDAESRVVPMQDQTYSSSEGGGPPAEHDGDGGYVHAARSGEQVPDMSLGADGKASDLRGSKTPKGLFLSVGGQAEIGSGVVGAAATYSQGVVVICAEGELTMGAYETKQALAYAFDLGVGYPASSGTRRDMPVIIGIDAGIGVQAGLHNARDKTRWEGVSRSTTVSTPSAWGGQVTTAKDVYSTSVLFGKTYGAALSNYRVITTWKMEPVSIPCRLCR